MAPKDDTKHYDSIPSDDSTAETPADDLKESIAAELPTNEYVLNVAFYSFIGFVLVQSVFACAAHSQSMLADAQAMSVDAMTYLCNLTAERIKNRPFSERELILPDCTRAHNRKVERLLLELVPPLISVATLITVTVMTLREALGVLLRSDKDDDADDVSVPLMLFFSGANLLLDIVNVTCFARAQSAYGFDVDVVKGHTDLGGRKESACRNCTSSEANETSLLLAMEDDTDQSNEASKRPGFNLNMCSAWTHVCADTLRSCAVLLAAAIAFVVPAVQGDVADSVAALVVSFIILCSLIPLIKGLIVTSVHLREALSRRHSPIAIEVVV